MAKNYKNFCTGKEYPMKDETKTSAEIQANEFR